MLELFMRHPWLLLTSLAVVSSAVVFVVAIVASAWRTVRHTDLEVALKQDMLNRGMSAEEIERILLASSSRRPAEPPAWEKADPISDNQYYLVEKLVDEGKSGEEIERIIQALRAAHKPGAFASDVSLPVG